MKKWFICPDRERITIPDCLTFCRLPERCCSPATLALVGENREWRGVSPSMAGKGDREIYLEQVHYYAVDPRSKMFMTLGTRHHAIKEEYASEHGEKNLGGPAGTIDDYEEATGTLYDYKSTGTGKLNRMAKKVEIPTGEYYVRGKNKGKAKSVQVVVGFDWEKGDSWVLQMNRYRMGMEELGNVVKKMVIEATLRDGGTYMARNSGFHENVYMIEVPFLDNIEVSDYYYYKDMLITKAFDMGKCPTPCTEEENWERRKCKWYCDVWEECMIEGGNGFSAVREIVTERRKNGT